MSREAQRGRILKRLKNGNWVSGSALESLGGNRYGARLDELRAMGAQIVSRSEGSNPFKSYRLVGWGEERKVRRRFDLTEDQLRDLARGILPETVINEAQQVLGLDRQPELF